MTDDGSPPEQTEGLRPKTRQFDRGRVARWVAITGVIAVVLATRSMIVPRVPTEREVDVQLDSPADVLGVDVRWSAAGSNDDIVTTSRHFSAGTAPSSVRTVVHLPDGAYDVAIAVERVTGVDSTRRRITLADTDHLTIPLR